MSDCDVVENVALGKIFSYCRVHKVEPKDCPQNKPKKADPMEAAVNAVGVVGLQQMLAFPPCAHCRDGRQTPDAMRYDYGLLGLTRRCAYCGREAK